MTRFLVVICRLLVVICEWQGTPIELTFSSRGTAKHYLGPHMQHVMVTKTYPPFTTCEAIQMMSEMPGHSKYTPLYSHWKENDCALVSLLDERAGTYHVNWCSLLKGEISFAKLKCLNLKLHLQREWLYLPNSRQDYSIPSERTFQFWIQQGSRLGKDSLSG